MEEIIQTNDLVMDYDSNTRAIDNVNLTIKKGEWVSIMGPSGSGKTTLLNIIGCLDKSTSGSLIVDGKKINGLNQSELTKFRREKIGFIFQQFHLIPYLTALENVMLSMYFNSLPDEVEAFNALKKVGLEHRTHHIPSHLSGGEQQRVAVARALINKPRILLADEPTGNLDQENGKTVLDLLKILHHEGNTIILVTHEPNIGKLGNRVIKMIDGRIVNNNINNNNKNCN